MDEKNSTEEKIAAKFRKKPVVIEAARWNGGAEAATAVIDWALSNGGTIRYHEVEPRGLWEKPERLSINTLEGTMYVAAGDWVIKGVAGEFYPCKPDIFEATYEAVEYATGGVVPPRKPAPTDKAWLETAHRSGAAERPQ